MKGITKMKITETKVIEFEPDKIGIERTSDNEFSITFEQRKGAFDMYGSDFFIRHRKTFETFDEALEYMIKYVGELK